MQHEAARPKGERSPGDEPYRQPMRATRQGEIRRNPSTDQKRARRANQRRVAVVDASGMTREAEWTPGHVECQSCGHTGHPYLSDTGPACSACNSYQVKKIPHGAPGDYNSQYAASKQATILNTQAWMLNPGDAIRLPNGRTQKVVRVRPHETSQKHVYVDTDGGTALAKREDGFEVVPHNSQQQTIPGYGIPGGNTNTLPGDRNHPTNAAPKTDCPVCGGKGTLVRRGDKYVCSRCGYSEQFGGAGGKAFTDAPSQVQTSASYSTVNSSMKSAVARRAEAMLNSKENQ